MPSVNGLDEALSRQAEQLRQQGSRTALLPSLVSTVCWP